MPDVDMTDEDDGSDDVGSQGGIFGQGEDVFDHAPPAPGSDHDPVNPQVTRAQEEEPENEPGAPAPQDARALVFFQDAMGNVTVAWAVNGNLVENPRVPTPDEMQFAPQARWRAVPPQQQQPQQPRAPVAMGMAALGQAAQPQQPVQVVPVQPAGSPLVKLLVLGGLAFGAYKAWEWYQEHADEDEDAATERELDEADDVDEESEV